MLFVFFLYPSRFDYYVMSAWLLKDYSSAWVSKSKRKRQSLESILSVSQTSKQPLRGRQPESLFLGYKADTATHSEGGIYTTQPAGLLESILSPWGTRWLPCCPKSKEKDGDSNLLVTEVSLDQSLLHQSRRGRPPPLLSSSLAWVLPSPIVAPLPEFHSVLH